MKFHLIFLSTILLTVIVASCGKKAEVQDSNKDKTQEPTVGELYFNAFQDIKKAVENNDLKTLKRTVQDNYGVDLNQILNDGDTFFIKAIRKDYREMRNYFIEKGIDYEKANVNSETPLMVAVMNGHINSVKVLLNLKVNLEKKNQKGDAPLHVAIKTENDEIASLLIKQGANIEATDSHEQTALMLIKEFKVPETVNLIQTVTKVDLGAPDTTTFIAILNSADVKRLNQVVNRFPSIIRDYEILNPLAILVDAKNENDALR